MDSSHIIQGCFSLTRYLGKIPPADRQAVSRFAVFRMGEYRDAEMSFRRGPPRRGTPCPIVLVGRGWEGGGLLAACDSLSAGFTGAAPMLPARGIGWGPPWGLPPYPRNSHCSR